MDNSMLIPPIEVVMHFDLFHTIKAFTSATHNRKKCFFLPSRPFPFLFAFTLGVFWALNFSGQGKVTSV